MVRFLLYIMLALLISGNGVGAQAAAKSWEWNGGWRNVSQLVKVLSSVPEGQAVLAQARKKNARFLRHVKPGRASFTESTFSRSYSLLDGKEQVQTNHEVTISQSLSLADAAVDLAHELVHFSEKQMLDPYGAGFTRKRFVVQGIEGQGGELDALAKECGVAWALERKYKNFPRHLLCQRYRGQGNVFQREQARRDYYALGAWQRFATDRLRKELPDLHAGEVVFTSSYAEKPYPLALAEEFASTRAAACANNRRKYRLISAQAQSGRVPASLALVQERMRLKSYERLYCSSEKAAKQP